MSTSIVKVYVVSPDTRSERRLELHTTVEKLKRNLEPITGIPTANQILTLYNSESDTQAAATLSDDSKQLGFYGIRDWQLLKVDDANPSVSFTGQLTDTSQVDKFEMSDKEYAERRDTVRAYKETHHMGRFAPKTENAEGEETIPADLTVGSRCEVESSEDLKKRGFVRFVGTTKFAKGVWVGIEYDEPFGKNDGSVQGERYFSCRDKYGAFVRPDRVKVGDYPVEELDLGDDEEM